MSLVISECINSRALSEVPREGRLEIQLERYFDIKGSDDPTAATVRAMGPKVGDQYAGDPNLWCYTRKFEPIVGAVGGAVKLTCTYGPADRLRDLDADPEYEVNMMAETVKIEVALAQIHHPAAASEVGNAIGVNGDKVDGVDIYVPKGAVTVNITRESFTEDYRLLLNSMVGKVNSKEWNGYTPEEVLFLGAVARRKGRGKWKVSFSFAIQETQTQVISTESGDQTFEKLGWRYMWLSRIRKGDAADATKVVHAVEAAHVAQVYETTDFTVLGVTIEDLELDA